MSSPNRPAEALHTASADAEKRRPGWGERLSELAAGIRFFTARNLKPLRDSFNRAPAGAPAVHTAPRDLVRMLNAMEASYKGRLGALERAGILEAGRLKLLNGTPVRIDGVPRATFEVADFSLVAERIRADAILQQRLAFLEAGPDGLPILTPDLRPASMQQLFRATQPGAQTRNGMNGGHLQGMAVYPFFDLGDDTDGNMVAFDSSLITDGEGRRGDETRLTKRSLLESGALGTKGLLGVSFVDGGPVVPRVTLGMSKLQAFSYCRALGLEVVPPETYHGIHAISPGSLDSRCATWLHAYHRPSGHALVGHWDEVGHGLKLRRICPRTKDYSHGARRALTLTF